MNRILFLAALTLAFLIPVYGQEHIPVHEFQKKQFGNQKLQKSLYDENGTDIIPLKPNKANSQYTVFGYLPYWEYTTARNYLQYDLLTHIAAFDFGADANGNISKPSYWPWTDVINKAHTNGVKIIMCVTNFSGADIKSIISSAANKQNILNNIKNIIQQYSLDGVNIDFESLAVSDRGSLINGFMTELTDSIHKALPGKEVSFAGPIVNWGGWDLQGLAKACDYIFIMGYDFYGNWSTTTGPSSPLTGGTYNLSSSLASSSFGYGAVIPSYSQKLILGVPYYGNRWLVSSNSPYTKVTKYLASTRFSSEIVNSATYGMKWDASSQTPWYGYKQTDTTWIQDWFDSDSSTGLKYNLALSKNLKGIGMWALGQDDSRPELWNVLRKKLLVGVKENEKFIPIGFVLSQNYPNPFNPSTVINYEIPKACKVTLSVHDLLGREVAVLADEEKPAGRYSAEFRASLPSGIYYYTLRAGDYTVSRKMMVLK